LVSPLAEKIMSQSQEKKSLACPLPWSVGNLNLKSVINQFIFVRVGSSKNNSLLKWLLTTQVDFVWFVLTECPEGDFRGVE
jgi:hypothetical protein